MFLLAKSKLCIIVSNMGIHKKLNGLRFGRLLVKDLHHKHERADKTGCYRYFYTCQCDCGNTCIVAADCLKSKHTQSCGCFRSEIGKIKTTKHNLSLTKLYRTLIAMRERCENPNRASYKYYGGRGIKVCKDWHNPVVFVHPL